MTQDDIIATLHESLLANGVPKDTVAKVIRDLRKAQEQEKAARPPVRKSRKTHAILVSDPEGRLKGMELVAFCVAMEEGAPPQVAYDRIVAAANRFNSSRKARKHPITTLGEAMEGLRGKSLQQERADQKLQIVTREACPLLAYPNKLPSDQPAAKEDAA